MTSLGLPTGSERRRAPRFRLHAPMTTRRPGKTLEGITQDVSSTGILVCPSGPMPVEGGTWDVTLKLARGQVEAVGKVARVDSRERLFAVEIQFMVSNGSVLKAELGNLEPIVESG